VHKFLNKINQMFFIHDMLWESETDIDVHEFLNLINQILHTNDFLREFIYSHNVYISVFQRNYPRMLFHCL